MGKLKKQTKASRARRLQNRGPLGGGDAMMDDEETPVSLPVAVEEKAKVRPVGANGPKKISAVTGETQGAMKTRQALEWKKVRREIEELKVQRRKIRKTEPDGAKRRKELSDRIKWLQVQYQGRVESERATLKPVETAAPSEPEHKEGETQSLRQEVETMKKQLAQMEALLLQKMA